MRERRKNAIAILCRTGGAGPRIEAPIPYAHANTGGIAYAIFTRTEPAIILFICERTLVEPGGFEPPTIRVQGGRSPN